MRIGFDAKRLYNNFTGLGNHSRTTLDILMEYFPENEYLLYTPKVKSTPSTAPYMFKDMPGRRLIMPKGWLKGSAWRTFGLPGELKRDGVDLFHGLSNELPVGIRRSGVRSIVTIHDVAFRTFTDMYHWQDRQIYDLKWRYAVKNADRIIAISECTKRDILRFYDVDEDKIDVVYQPVGIRYYDPLPSERPGENSPYMLYVGSVNSRKNLLGIVKAMKLMPKDLRLPLVVVGGGREYKVEVERYVAAHGLEAWVRWAGQVDPTQLQALYQGASLFVYPSFYEGFGLPVVEALLSGCPVVTSDVSSLPEAGGPWALKADPASPEDISQKMQTALTDSLLRADMIRGGREYAMNTFHPQVLAEQLMKVYGT